MQARWLKNPATGVVFPATDALLARGDLVPVADEAGAPLVTAADAKAIEREMQDLHAENAEMRQRLADQATEIAVLRATLDQAERDLARARAVPVEPKPVTLDAPPKPVTLDVPPKPVTLDVPPKPVTLDVPPKPVTLDAPPPKAKGARRAAPAEAEAAPAAASANDPAPAGERVDDLAASLASLNI